jgi:glutamate mutase epsilon subunit
MQQIESVTLFTKPVGERCQRSAVVSSGSEASARYLDRQRQIPTVVDDLIGGFPLARMQLNANGFAKQANCGTVIEHAEFQ